MPDDVPEDLLVSLDLMRRRKFHLKGTERRSRTYLSDEYA